MIALDKSEALVLFEWLACFNEMEENEIKQLFKHPSEAKLLYHLEGILEKQLLEPFLLPVRLSVKRSALRRNNATSL